MRREALWEYLKGALWALPTVAVVVALAAGSVLSSINLTDEGPMGKLLFQGTPDDARNLLIGIASTMVTVIALVLGLTVVALQLASTQFSPRLLRNFLRDRVNQVTLSIFVATFAYSTAGLYTVGVSAGQRTDDFPRMAVTGALVLLFASLLMLVYFVHHLVHSIQVDEVMQHVQESTLHVIRASMASGDGRLDRRPVRPMGALAVTATRSGYVQTFHFDSLLKVLATRDLVAEVVPMMGEHVIQGAPLLWVWTARHQEGASVRAEDVAGLRQAARESIRLGRERTMEQDAAFGVRQLADIGSKALSPAINDPYTAVQAVDHLAVILAELGPRRLGSLRIADGSGSVRLHVRGRDFDYYLDLALGQVRRYGSQEPRVVAALLRTLAQVGGFCTDPAVRAVLAHQAALVLADAERAVTQPADFAPLREHAHLVLAELQPVAGG
ncbi:MAG TPA: DUF2254 domain-containing protein [Dermatophilaceae bacterium]|nr:DUF2254 domain-containing protein [Dermatophilaceae bacterium]